MQNDSGKSKEAIVTILKALKTYPNNEQLLRLAYSIYSDRGNTIEAKNVLNTLVKIFPNSKQYQ
jgi:TolA-binding protein